MMRSLYSAVSGLKSHQTKMDVIGNNIANVNTVAFKSSSVTFSDVMYQTTSMASSPNAATGVGGINAKQIGLGSTMATSKVSISQAGATQTTGSALDCKINGKSFFVVSDGKSNFFTRVGSFTFDAAGNLVMNSTGYNVMGWQVDPATGDIKKDTVSALRIMSAENMISNPEATTDAYVSGVLDSNSTAVKTDSGYSMNLNFYDALGYQYTAKFKATEGNTAGEYKISLTDILDSNSKSIFGNTDIVSSATITAGDLFGNADTNSADSGSLLTGRKLNRETSMMNFINTMNNNKDVTAEPPVTIIDGSGNKTVATTTTTTDPSTGKITTQVEYVTNGDNTNKVTVTTITDKNGKVESETIVPSDKTVPKMEAVYLTSTSNDRMIDNGYFFTDGEKFYAATTLKGNEVVFVELSNFEDDYSAQVASEKGRIRTFFADNFAGIDPNIYYDGTSTWNDATEYFDVLTLNGNSFKTVSPYRLEVDDSKTPKEYTLKNSSTNKVEAGPLKAENMYRYLSDPNIFSTSMNTTDLQNMLTAVNSSVKQNITGATSGKIELEDGTNKYTFTNVTGVTVADNGSGGYPYTVANSSGSVTINKLGDWASVLSDTNYFTQTATKLQGGTPATNANASAISAMCNPQSLTETTELNQFENYVIGVNGTSYYTQLKFDTDTGVFKSIGNADTAILALSNLNGNFSNITMDFTGVTNFNNGGSSTMGMDRGAKDGSTGAGKKLGSMTGVSIDTNGMIYGSYDNGNTTLLGQIAVTEFSNPEGLEQVGDSLYQTTLNSGEFDGIGIDITSDGGSLTTGALEMSNVDLSNEFTDMITTQRGFQANSRVITTSDTLLEELINLKR